MKIKRITLLLFLLIITTLSFTQNLNWRQQIDSLLSSKSDHPFNGIIFVSQNGKTEYCKTNGYSDLEAKVPLQFNDQFIIGSISKQFTAALVLIEYDKGYLQLNVPIHQYLPELTQNWADTVTITHLLTHLHGITELDKPTLYTVGTQYAYSQIGYDLLAKIVDRTSGKSFAQLSKELFRKCGMKHTFHPDTKEYKRLTKGYTENENGAIEFEKNSFQNYVAAGSFISTVADLNIWNEHLYNGNLLKKETLKMLKTKQKGAIRNHPIFGTTEYGLGITVETKENLLQLGQTGFAPGFVSMNYFFPKSKTSVIVLENIAYNTDDLKTTFLYHTEILKIIRTKIKEHNL